MTVLSDLQAQLESLRSARASGTRSVEYASSNGVKKRVEYRSDSELAAAIADVERRIAVLTGPRITSVRFQTSKGL